MKRRKHGSINKKLPWREACPLQPQSLPQPQYSPLSVEEQVAVVYAGTRGYLDGIATAQVSRYEQELLAHLHGKHQKILDAIRTEKALGGALETELKAVLDAFTSNFA